MDFKRTRHTQPLVLFFFAQALLTLLIGLPGQMSVDALMQLYEGQQGLSYSFNPPTMSILLGGFDKLGSGPILFVLLMQALISYCLWVLLKPHWQAKLSRRTLLALLVLANPVIMIYTGIVWKDVLLAHTVLALYLLLYDLSKAPLRRNLPTFVVVIVLMTLAMGSRQQGILFVIPAAVCCMFIYCSRWLLRLTGSIAIVVIVVTLASSLSATLPKAPGVNSGVNSGLKNLFRYDVAGTIHFGGILKTDEQSFKEQFNSDAQAYSPYRVDTLTYHATTWAEAPFNTVLDTWADTIYHSPAAYLQHRFTFFQTLLGLRGIAETLPFHYGVSYFTHWRLGSLAKITGLEAGPYAHSQRVYQALRATVGHTPLFMQFAYLCACLIATGLLLHRREFVLATLGCVSIAFAFSYFFVGLACDFRYLYTMSLATIFFWAFLILNPKKHHTEPLNEN